MKIGVNSDACVRREQCSDVDRQLVSISLSGAHVKYVHVINGAQQGRGSLLCPAVFLLCLLCFMLYVSYVAESCVICVTNVVCNREGDPKGWSTVLITALGSWEKSVPRGHS
jgi:hypothetical protein